MSEIKSVTSIADMYVTTIKSANSTLANDATSISEDGTTSLAVNTNSTSLNNATKQAVSSIFSKINDDCGRITSVATLFEEKDRALAGGN